MSTDPGFVNELQEQVRLLGNRVLALDQELDQKRAYISRMQTDNKLFNRIRDERGTLASRVAGLKQELAAEKKRRQDADRLVAALQRELETKAGLLERLQVEAELSEHLSAVEPLLGTLHEAVLSLSERDS